MHFNILLTLSTLTALSSNAAAQFPLSGINGLGGLGPSSQTPGPSSTAIPTLTRQATPIAPSQTPTLSTPVPNDSASSGGLKDSLSLNGLLGGALGGAL
ncbi:hypothetical protein N7491_008245 [Penicillium cf. griseofulvum]|uniref:Uncharacterized protein n=1 Tax=Penicillium cf. griseofulvum TaxID=2972120 RepID=A0A9W9J3I3_9EURO|nr:hypothetical protein N7472_008724 [Penicillium cf. griseofulvum]KAJ5427803.1 hypothetical protein N7491_008245 [Penicillium cf. griseofulvum]KAJ5432005.1 hypothetical protein N7445_008503 [Penicillium cf. griseofulvum]